MSETLFGTALYQVCVGELKAALAAMKALGKNFTTITFDAEGVEGCAWPHRVRVRLFWVDGGPRDAFRVDRLYLLAFLAGAPDGALLNFEIEDKELREVSVVKHGVELRSKIPAGTELTEEVRPKFVQAEEIVVDSVGAAAFFRVAEVCAKEEGSVGSWQCVRIEPSVAEATFLASDGRELRAEEVRLVGGPVFDTAPVAVPPIVREVMAKWAKWKESPLELAWTASTAEQMGRWLRARCGGLMVETLVAPEAEKWPTTVSSVLATPEKAWLWRIPQSERERLAALVPVMPPEIWGSDNAHLLLECLPGVTESVSRLTLTIAENTVPVRAELRDQPDHAEGVSVALDPVRFLSALSGGIEEVIFGEPVELGADVLPVLFRGPHVRHVVMPMRILKDEGEKAGETSATKETSGATVTISTPGMAPVTLTEENFKKLAAKRAGKAKKKKAAEAGEGDESHG